MKKMRSEWVLVSTVHMMPRLNSRLCRVTHLVWGGLLILVSTSASASCNYDMNGVGYGDDNGRPCPYRGNGGGSTSSDQGLQQGAGALGTAIGKGIGNWLFGNPQQNATNQAAEQAAARAAEQQRQAEEQRRAEEERRAEEQRRADEERQQELAKQRILGQLKGADQSDSLKLKTVDSDTSIVRGTGTKFFGSGRDSGQELHLKLVGDDADSRRASKGFDTSGKIMISKRPDVPPTPTIMTPEQKVQLEHKLMAKLKTNEAQEQSLKDKLSQLEQAPAPDPVAIDKVKDKILVKEKERKKIKLDLTAVDDSGTSPSQPQSPSTGSNP